MIKNFLLKPYSLLSLKSFKWLFCLAGPVLSFVYILAVKPYGFSWFNLDEQIRLSLYYSLPVIGIWFIHLFILVPAIFKKMHVLNTILLLAWIHFVITMYVYSFSEIYIFDSQFDWYFLPETFAIVYKMGGGLTLFLMVIHLGYLNLGNKEAITNLKKS